MEEIRDPNTFDLSTYDTDTLLFVYTKLSCLFNNGSKDSNTHTRSSEVPSNDGTLTYSAYFKKICAYF